MARIYNASRPKVWNTLDSGINESARNRESAYVCPNARIHANEYLHHTQGARTCQIFVNFTPPQKNCLLYFITPNFIKSSNKVFSFYSKILLVQHFHHCASNVCRLLSLSFQMLFNCVQLTKMNCPLGNLEKQINAFNIKRCYYIFFGFWTPTLKRNDCACCRTLWEKKLHFSTHNEKVGY